MNGDESAKRGKLWEELRNVERTVAAIRERLAKVETSQAGTARLAWLILAAVVASWAHQYFGG